MKKSRRIISIFISLLMIVLFMQVSFAEDIAYGDDGNIHWVLNKNTGVLTITGNGSMPVCSQFHCPWGWQSSTVKKVIVENGITSIGENSFSGENNLTQIVLPESLTAIREGAFNGCCNIETILIPESVKIIEYGAFCGCALLSSINIPKQVQTISKSVFSGCSSLTEIELPDSITSIDQDAFFGCKRLKTISIPKNVVSIGIQAFRGCQSLRSVTLPDGLASIGFNAFQDCSELENIIIPNSVQSVEANGFYDCINLTNVTLSNGITEISSNLFNNCAKLKAIIIPSRVSTIEASAFHSCNDLREVSIPRSVKSIERSFTGCYRLKDIYYEGTEDEWNDISIHADDIEVFSQATIHYGADPTIWYPQEANIYNLGEETYSFRNYSDNHSAGHCFGMAVTSSGYYLGNLNKTIIGGNNDNTLYSFDDTSTVRAPICHYFQIQGPGAEYQSIVAGGNMDLNNMIDTTGDWNTCVNYVKDHSFDNRGSLNVGMWYDGGGGHAVNFLYYAEVDGQERIYVYDNNFPEDETYYYLESDGLIYQAPLQTAPNGIVGFDLMDVESYFSLAAEFQRQRFVYAIRNTIAVENAKMYNMKCNSPQGDRVMFELPADITEVTITPLVENASFTYMDKTYTFGAIDEDSYGVLTLSETEDGTGTFVIENAPGTQPDNPQPQPDPNMCHWCGKVHEGFFQKIIGFFHNILAKIFGNKY